MAVAVWTITSAAFSGAAGPGAPGNGFEEPVRAGAAVAGAFGACIAQPPSVRLETTAQSPASDADLTRIGFPA